MRTIQMTLEDDLVEDVDRISKQLNTNRSAFTRKALREALNRYNIKEMERRHSQGYKQYPVNTHEFSVWENEQAWGDE
ncbi:ribbon-helix-helix domain-containing protein [Thermodesulfobacteriota bacterium]